MNENTDRSAAIDQQLSDELGFDVRDIELQICFRREHQRLQAGETGELGYVRIHRQHSHDLVIVFATPQQACDAVNEHPLVDDLVEEDCLGVGVLEHPRLVDLIGCEVILAS